jgi:hypothetical protein
MQSINFESFDIDDINYELKVNNINYQVINNSDEYHDIYTLVDNNNNVIKTAEFIDELFAGIL